MRVVVALGGNALLRRGEPLNVETQRANVEIAAQPLGRIAARHRLVVTHGNGPQVGLLALQSVAEPQVEPYPLDVLGAETEGMIGYLIEQELGNILPVEQMFATVLTQVEVDPKDPAFLSPSKPIGPVYSKEIAERLRKERGWAIARDGEHYRRVVASPRPKHIFEIRVIRLLVDRGVIVICAGGGGIPTAFQDDGRLAGVEAVIEKDHASGLLARELEADAYLMLTDADAVWVDWRKPTARAIRRVSPAALRRLEFEAGSMGPKIEAALDFVEATDGFAGIGPLERAERILDGQAGTIVTREIDGIEFYESTP